MTPYPINAKRENINSSYIIEILSFIEAAIESNETIKAPTAVNAMLRINFLVSLFKLLFLQIKTINLLYHKEKTQILIK